MTDNTSPLDERLEDPEFRAEYERSLDDLLETRFNPRYTSEHIIEFYGGPFSNFARSPFIAQDQWGGQNRYPTNEHYFQAWKATTPYTHQFLLRAKTPKEVKKRGGLVTLRNDWEEIKYNVMVEGLRHKFTLDQFRTKLLETGDAQIREDSPTDFVWGYRNNGLNLLGRALMQVRREIRENEAG